MNAKNMFRKLVKDAKAFSPIVAVLMLVLISVGSAGAFFVWQSGWQGGLQENAAENDELLDESYLMIGGSSTVYPVSVDAAAAFMNDHPQFLIEVKKGGSDSGIIGCGEEILDIGAASKNPGTDDFEKYTDLTVTTIGYDGVVMIAQAGHGIEALNATQIKTIYALNGGLDTSYDPLGLDADDSDTIEWSEIETYPGSGTNCTGGTIQVYERAEKSGTEECFCKKLMDKEFGSQISMGKATSKSVWSNQELVDAIANDANALGFMAYGIAKEEGSVKMIQYSPYFAEGYSAGDETTDDYNSTRDAGIPNFADIGSGVYKGSRPLNYLTLDEPEGLEQKFIDYVLWTSNNQEFLHDNSYVSIYD